MWKEWLAPGNPLEVSLADITFEFLETQVKSNKLLEEALLETPGDEDYVLAISENEVRIFIFVHKPRYHLGAGDRVSSTCWL